MWHPSLARPRRRRAVVEEEGAREDSAKEQYGTWLDRFGRILEEVDAVSLKEAHKAEDVKAAVEGLIGSSRVQTVKLRVRAWEAFRRWLEVRRGRRRSGMAS